MELTNNVHAFFQNLARKYERVQRVILRSFSDGGNRLSIFMMDVSSADTPVAPLTGILKYVPGADFIPRGPRAGAGAGSGPGTKSNETLCAFLKCDHRDEFDAQLHTFFVSANELAVFKKQDRVVVFFRFMGKTGKIHAFKGNVRKLSSEPHTWLNVLSEFPKPVIATVVHKGGSSNVKLSINIQRTRTPKLIGKGAYGCVYYPPLPCKNPCTSKYCKTGVSKLMVDFEAEDEMKAYEKIKEIDPKGKYHWAAEQICELPDGYEIPEKEKCNAGNVVLYDGAQLASIIMPYGGKPLDAIFMNNVKVSTFIVNSFENLFEALVVFKKNNFVHGDIKSDNAMFVGDPRNSASDPVRLKFIDFGLSFTLNLRGNPFAHTDKFTIEHMSQGSYRPPEINLWNRVFGRRSSPGANDERFRADISIYAENGMILNAAFSPKKIYPEKNITEESESETEEMYKYYEPVYTALQNIHEGLTKPVKKPDERLPYAQKLRSLALKLGLTKPVKKPDERLPYVQELRSLALKIDVFAMGVIMAKLYYKLIIGQADKNLLENDLFREKLKTLIRGMLDPNFTTRFDAEQSLAAFKEMKDELIFSHHLEVDRKMTRRGISRRSSTGSIRRK